MQPLISTKLHLNSNNKLIFLTNLVWWAKYFCSTTAKLPNQDEALAEEVVANHFLLGEEIKLAELKKDQKRRTAGGQQLVFKVDKNGECRYELKGFSLRGHATKDKIFNLALFCIILRSALKMLCICQSLETNLKSLERNDCASEIEFAVGR